MAERSRRQKRKERKQQRNLVKKICCIISVLLFVALLFLIVNEHYLHFEGVPTITELMEDAGFIKRPKVHVEQDEIAVHFIDVGQGDCTLIKTSDKNVLIDCGEGSEASNVISYLKSFGVTRLDYVIATHPHSDHMGGMYRILNAFDVGEVIIPEIPERLTPTTEYYEKFLDVIEERNIGAFYAIQGQKFQLCEGTVLEILGPLGNEYDDLNDFSVVAKLTSGNYSFLFTGDMETVSEEKLMEYWINVRADVLKVAHHGSSSSSSTAFLKRIDPDYAVISVGEGNSYGHPTSEVLKRLKYFDCEILTTMDKGDIVFITDGNELKYVTTNSGEDVA